MVDIEADGPCPADFSMVCFGAVVVEPGLDRTYYSGLIKPVSDKWIPDALAVSGFTREQAEAGRAAADVMAEFQRWLKGLGGQRYIISANEGDARDYGGYSEEVRVKNAAVVLDATAFPNAAALKTDAQLGRLNITTANGTNTAGEYEALYCYGARSITIWRSNGQRVWDSGEQMERITWAASPNFFNASNTDNELDSRSDNKGPEPEGLAMGEIDGRHYVFVGLERVGGIMVWDVTNPSAPWFQTYINPRDFNTPATSSAAGDLGPEGLVFVPAADSPNGKDLLIVGNEVSGTVTIFQVSKILE